MRYLLPFLIFTALILLFVVGLSRDPTEVPSPLIGKPAPRFVLPRLDNPDEFVDQETFAGQVTLVNVWAPWCVGCRQEHDMLLRIAASGVVPIVGLNWKDNRDAALDWLRRLGNPYTVSAFDAAGDVGIDWGVYGAPETFLVDADGAVRYKRVGPLTEGIWQTELLPLIRSLNP